MYIKKRQAKARNPTTIPSSAAARETEAVGGGGGGSSSSIDRQPDSWNRNCELCIRSSSGLIFFFGWSYFLLPSFLVCSLPRILYLCLFLFFSSTVCNKQLVPTQKNIQVLYYYYHSFSLSTHTNRYYTKHLSKLLKSRFVLWGSTRFNSAILMRSEHLLYSNVPPVYFKCLCEISYCFC